MSPLATSISHDLITLDNLPATNETAVQASLALYAYRNGQLFFERIMPQEYLAARNPQQIMPTATVPPVAVIPTASPAPTSLPLTSSSTQPSPVTGMTAAQFERYIETNYNRIGGASLDIEWVNIMTDYSNIVSISLTPRSGLYTFGDQTEAVATEYAERLFNDAYAFFGETDFAIFVGYSEYTRSLQNYHYDEDWWSIGDYRSGSGWFVSREYVKGFYISGRKWLEVWNFR